MSTSENSFENQLRIYVVLYFMLGLIETRLRTRIVITLSSFAFEKGYLEWIYVVPATRGNIRSMRKAFKKNKFSFDGIEKHLTFSFWRHLFDGKNYTSLWVPALYLVFPSLSNPLQERSSRQVGNQMAKANSIRNRVAHYEFHSLAQYESDKAVLLWLMNAMEGVSP